jgi:hypothetical protein
MPGFFLLRHQASVMVVIVTTVVTMVAVVAMMIGTVVVTVITTITVVSNEATAEGDDGRKKHGDEKQAFHGSLRR